MKVLAIYAEAHQGSRCDLRDQRSDLERVETRRTCRRTGFVAVDDAKKILGWTALSRFSERREYAGVVECYTFVRADAHRTRRRHDAAGRR